MRKRIISTKKKIKIANQEAEGRRILEGQRKRNLGVDKIRELNAQIERTKVQGRSETAKSNLLKNGPKAIRMTAKSILINGKRISKEDKVLLERIEESATSKKAQDPLILATMVEGLRAQMKKQDISFGTQGKHPLSTLTSDSAFLLKNKGLARTERVPPAKRLTVPKPEASFKEKTSFFARFGWNPLKKKTKKERPPTRLEKLGIDEVK